MKIDRRLMFIGVGFISLLVLVVLGLSIFSSDKKQSSNINSTDGFLQLEIEPKEALPVEVFVNGEAISRQNTTSARRPLPPGDHDIRIVASGFEEETFSVTIATDARVLKKVRLSTKVNAEENIVLKSISSDSEPVSLENGFWVVNTKYFLDKTWLAGTLTTTTEATDGEFVVLKRQSGKWEIVYAGTGYDEQSLRAAGVPSSLIPELEKIAP